MEKWEFDIQKERIDTQFWITPNGKIKKWKGSLREADNWTSLHEGIASLIMPNAKEGQASDVLHKLGWIAIGSACYGNRIDREPTQAQMNTLYDLGISRIQEMDCTIHEW